MKRGKRMKRNVIGKRTLPSPSNFLNQLLGMRKKGFHSPLKRKEYALHGMRNRQDHGKQLNKNQRVFFTLLFLFRLIGSTAFLIIFELAFISMLSMIKATLTELWILQLWVFSTYCFYLLMTHAGTRCQMFKIFNYVYTLLMLFLVSGVFCVLILFFKHLLVLKLIFGAFSIYYSSSLILYLKTENWIEFKRQMFPIALIILLLTSNIALIISFYFRPTTFQIVPRSTPELVFLCGTEELPESEEELKICRKYNIGFMPVITKELIGNDFVMKKYKQMLYNNINLHFLMGGNSSFYAYIHNSREFHYLYRNIRLWFDREGILHHPALRAFYVDAETPEEMLQDLFTENVSDSTNLGLEQFPLASDIEKATKNYRELITMIHEDNQSCGMVRASYFFDTADRDADLSLYTNNIYTLDLPWDHELTMCYRTHYAGYQEGFFHAPSHVKILSTMFLGGTTEEEIITMSEFNLYQIVTLESERASSPRETHEQHFFLGNFDEIFSNSRYIKAKEFYTDVDICRHVGCETLFFYDLGGFLYHYGWQGMIELGLHVRKHHPIYIQRESTQTMFFLLYCCGMILIDQFAFLEWELN